MYVNVSWGRMIFHSFCTLMIAKSADSGSLDCVLGDKTDHSFPICSRRWCNSGVSSTPDYLIRRGVIVYPNLQAHYIWFKVLQVTQWNSWGKGCIMYVTVCSTSGF